MRKKLYCGDALPILKSVKTECIDCIFTDPPYADLEDHRKIGTTTRLQGEWFETIPNEEWSAYFKEWYRVLKKGAHLYVMGNSDSIYTFKPIGEAAGFKYWNTLTWKKGRTGMGWHYRKDTLFILFFEKRVGRHHRNLNDKGLADSLTDRVVGLPDDFIEEFRIKTKKDRKHPVEVPPELIEVFLRQSTQPGQLVLDPFMGAGSSGVAAFRSECDYLGIELEQKWVDTAQKWMEGKIQ